MNDYSILSIWFLGNINLLCVLHFTLPVTHPTQYVSIVLGAADIG